LVHSFIHSVHAINLTEC